MVYNTEIKVDAIFTEEEKEIINQFSGIINDICSGMSDIKEVNCVEACPLWSLCCINDTFQDKIKEFINYALNES